MSKEFIEKKWEHLTRGIPQETQLSYLLENVDRISLPPCNGLELFYEKNKHKITAKIWQKLLSKKLFGIQALLGDEDKIYYLKHEKEDHPNGNSYIKSIFKSEKIESKFNQYQLALAGEGDYLDNDKIIDNFASVIASEIHIKALNQIINHIGINCQWDFSAANGDTIKEKYEDLYVELVKISDAIKSKCLVGDANFIYTSPEIASIFESRGFMDCSECSATQSPIEIQYVGNHNSKWRIYKDISVPKSTILMGHYNESSMIQGFMIGLKTLFQIGGKTLNSHKFLEFHPIGGNFDMKFVSEGWKYFSVINVKNLII